MESKPNLRLEAGELVLRASQGALTVEKIHLSQVSKGVPFVPKDPEAVLGEAKVRVIRGGGDPFDDLLLASQSAMQFGQYRGKTFKWMLENDLGYSLMVLSGHQWDRETGKLDRGALMANKDAFLQYAYTFKKIADAIKVRRQREGTLPGCEGDCLVGFGVHKKSTYKELYEATDRDRKSYVRLIRSQDTNAGSKMDALQKYILGRDQQNIRAEGKRKTSSASQPVVPHPSHPASPPPTQSWHSQPATAHEPTDDDLLASAMEVETQVLPPPSTPICSPRLAAQSLVSAASEVVLPEAWKRSLPKEQHEWIGRSLFRKQGGKAVLTDNLQMWWYPPQPRLQYHQPPVSPDVFFTWPLCLWMPYRMWSYKLICSLPNCRQSGQQLTSCGLYKTVRRVLNLHSWYLLATEYLECQRCHKKQAAWSYDILGQLDPAHRRMFPAILTYRFSCDMHVAKLMRERSLCNSASMLYHKLCEQHSEDWMERSLQYLSVCDRFQGTTTRPITPPPPMPPVPTAKWLLYVHAEDVRSRYGELKARVTSVFGSILKMSSTKKVAKKLVGTAAETTALVTNVGNEHGQVLMSVLISHEGQGLLPMTTGLVNRYKAAGVAPPALLYVDRDCCSSVGTSRAGAMFSSWSDLVVRLDVWHFMRRFAAGLHTDSHPLYGLFMAKLSACIFVWDEGDVALLRDAKRRELKQGQGITGLTDELLTSRLTSRQLAQHCRRCTRGVEVTVKLIGEMLEAFKDARETMGIPLVDQERMDVIWGTQRRHLPCIQDPPGVQLYTQTGSITKGGLTLPVYRCVRGSTSLESFHNHLNRFIPGTSANLENFQAYLLEGLERWNEDRAAAAFGHKAPSSLRCYSASLQHSLNELSQCLLGKTLVQDSSKPRQYTGELIGVEYLCSQQSWEFRDKFGRDPDAPDGIPDNLVEVEDEGFVDEVEEQDRTISPLSLLYTKEAIRLSQDVPSPSQSSQDLPLEPQEEVCRGPDGTPGFDRVVELARYLVELREKPCVSDREAADIVRLWDRLPDSDKQGVSYPSRHKDRLLQGRFNGKESLKRCVLGQGSGPAQWPNISRIVEAVCLELCSIHPARKVKWGVSMNRWAAILHDYQAIRRLVGNCPALRGNTKIQLFDLNQRTLSVWYNNYSKKLEVDVLALSVPLPQISMVSHTPLPAAKQKALLHAESGTELPPFPFVENPDMSGQAIRCGQRPPHPVPTLPAAAPPASAPSAPPAAVPSAPPAAVPSAPPAAAPSTPLAAPRTSLSRTTLWRKRKAAELLAREQGLPRAQQTPRKDYTCSQCGRPGKKEFGHTRAGGFFYCATAEGKTVEEWMQEIRNEGNPSL
ncbi:uncharacterized protein LOC127623665 [Xyrauchen texanus]|uniref:uncharacterized protein LOC127623665 n=1 Tax=Xyrauchen texanus TaxID=154827 RepID=UPI00224235DA|nr:uncharacterized protein LOC127623665 [Xyrauchen texanus]